MFATPCAWLIIFGEEKDDVRYTWANHPAAGKAGIVRLLAIEHHLPALPDRAQMT